jgi:lysine 2,3-aminomutase
MEKEICTIKQLKEYINLPPKEEKKLEKIVERHPMRITAYYLSLIDWNDPHDPIKKMAVPSLDEFNLQGSYDTSGEAENTKLQGLQHKYAETALVLATNRCAVYCRHCFRKRLIGLPSEEVMKRFEDAATYVKHHEEINNVLISGGDPFMLSNEILEKFLATLSDISHLDFIRFGSRAPVTFPSRFEDQVLLAILDHYSHTNKRMYVVTQFNHPREVTRQSTKAVHNLIKSEILVNNQTVLLKGVNDDPAILGDLQNKLVGIGVIPYYVFQCRPVKRVKHSFQVPICRGARIVEEAKAQCNGHSKRFKYIMSHRTGKIEILGIADDEIYFKYHQAKNPKNLGKILKRQVDEKAGWLDDLESPCGRPESSLLSFLGGIPLREMAPQKGEITGGGKC